MARKLRLGTRGSRLALEQTRLVSEMLSAETPGIEFQVVIVKTRGDSLPPAQRGEADGKGYFTEDIESLLLRGEIDLAVHSLKDLSVELDARLMIAATPRRSDPRDALVSPGFEKLQALPSGASLGTSSARRRVQLLKLREDLRVVDLHGNVETRVGKMKRLGIDGVVLAAAGLDRLSLGRLATERFATRVVVPAVGQGTLGVEVRRRDRDLERMVSRIGDEKTMMASECEREFARAVGADCNLPVGAHASFNGRSLTLTGMIASADGSVLKRSMTSTEPGGLGRALGEEMLKLGGATIMERSGQ